MIAQMLAGPPDANAPEDAAPRRRPVSDAVARPHDTEGRAAGQQQRRRFRSQMALAAGFAIVFALWLAWGYQLIRGLERIEADSVRMHDAHVRGEQILLKLRTNVLLGSIYLRDAIIDAGSPRREYYRQELSRLREETDHSLRSYMPEVTSSDERDHWVRLHSELGEFWASRQIVFSDTAPASSAEAAALVRQRVVPRRVTVLAVLDQLAALQVAANGRRQDDTLRLYQRARAQLLSLGGLSLATALGVALMASIYVGRLQRQIERQRASEQQHREELERLSARLLSAQESERQNLARELHDEVGQALTAVKMDIGIAMRAGEEPRVKAALAEASELVENTLRGVRDLSQLLHPSTLDDFGLPTAVAAYCRGFSERTGIRAQLAETIDQRFAPVVETSVYRIVQEALNNVARHSGATACTILLTIEDGHLRLVIEDNGRGVTPEGLTTTARRGLGLISMRERAQALGGTFSLTSGDGGGTRISVTLPPIVALTVSESSLSSEVA